MVVIFIIAIFSAILVADFPRIKKQFSLSRAAYKLGQDVRRVEDLGLSGVQVSDRESPIGFVKGYGIFFDLSQKVNSYLIYADVADGTGESNQQFDGSFLSSMCQENTEWQTDCIVEIINLTNENQDLVIKNIENINGRSVSINFSPPNPDIKINNICDSTTCGSVNNISIVLGLAFDEESQRKVIVNKIGMIEVQ